MQTTRYTITALADNVPGVMHRLSIVFTRRKINVESLTVAETNIPGTSRFTFTVRSDEETISKVLPQIKKVIELHHVHAHRDDDLIFKEIAFLRVPGGDSQIDGLIRGAGAEVVDSADGVLTLQKAGTEAEIDALVAELSKYGLKEVVRSGRIALPRAA